VVGGRMSDKRLEAGGRSGDLVCGWLYFCDGGRGERRSDGAEETKVPVKAEEALGNRSLP
jgi:hypothetical protein